MTDPTTGQPAVSRLLNQQETMQGQLTELKVGQARIETKLDTMCEQRREQHTEHTACLAQRECAFESNAQEHDRIWERLNQVTTWGKAIAIVGSILATGLGILIYIIALGEKLV